MSKARSGLLTLLPRRYPGALLGALVLWLSLVSLDLAWAQAPCDTVKPAEDWARCLIKHGEWADFNKRCSTKTPPTKTPPDRCSTNLPLDPKNEECRTISSHFVTDLLAGTPQQEKLPFAGVQIAGARIIGDVKLEDTKFIRPIKICNSRIEGEFNLDHAQTDSLISLNESVMTGNFLAEGLHAESDLFLNGAAFRREVNLSYAKIKGHIDMTAVSVVGKLNAGMLQVDGDLLMQSYDRNKARFNDVSLRNANIKGQMAMFGASFGDVDADNVQIGGFLLRQTDGQNSASFKNVVLHNAKIERGISMEGAYFGGTLDAKSLEVGGDLSMNNVYCVNETFMAFAHVGGNLDLRDATLPGLDLSGVSVAADLRLGGRTSTVWTGQHGEPRALILRNTHVGNLADAKNAWPEKYADPRKGYLQLDGFSFNHLVGLEGETEPQMRDRGMEWWDNWARLDPDYGPAPFAQLAAALTSAGHRDDANEVRYYGRVREREAVCKKTWVLGSCFLQTALGSVAGFGIGIYTFQVLYWVIGISLAGAALLWKFVPAAKQHGPIWCFGASLSRLLPVIEINKEFTDFFNDPKGKRMTGWQSFIFSVIGIVGFVLGAILIAAVSGLTQSS
jgi:uncharacterized protein YjbI with pentapeptide repeats